tara:strand:+ start:7261 stop:7575 length:315 start_codon:yes stop_codon:yes gene_type:complete
MKALGDRILITPIVEEIKTESGLLMSRKDVEEKRYAKAIIVSKGELIETLKKGGIIHYDKSAGHAIMDEGNLYEVIKYRDVALVDDKIHLPEKLIKWWQSLINK